MPTTSGKAFGSPGIAPTWCSSAKDLVTSSLGPSRVWATIGRGILNEVYWPTTGRPQIRDLGFLVADETGWTEVKRFDEYSLETPTPFAPLPTIRHTGPNFQLTLEVACDPSRDCVLIRYRLQSDSCRVYALLAPRLGAQGVRNTAWVDEHLFAEYEEHALCLAADGRFSRASAGFVGASDGWQDFARNGGMTWTFERAPDGNVALMGELARDDGVLALAFSETSSGARTLALSALADGFDSTRRSALEGWEQWGKDIPFSVPDGELRHQARLSAAVLKMCEDRTYPGAVVASLSVPWGNSRDDLGGYHLVWARDCVESGFAMLAIGQFAEARNMLAYLIATQAHDGHWTQNFYPGGEPYWTGVQLDETAFPILLSEKLREMGLLDGLSGLTPMIQAAVRFLVRKGPVTPQDRWEESEGISPFTLAVEIAALTAAASVLEDEQESDFAASFADYLNERVEDWVYVSGSGLSRRYGVEGHYIRIAPPSVLHGDLGTLSIANTGGRSFPAEDIVSLEFLYLVRLGLREATDAKVKQTMQVVEGELGMDTPAGRGYRRYSHDGYGEHEDGAPFDGSGKGRLWPLLTGEIGHLALLSGNDVTPFLQTMVKMAGRGGLLPEQVWDEDAPSGSLAQPGRPTGSAMPLLWAHAEYLKLIAARKQGVPIESLDSVKAKYGGKRPAAKTWHWRADAPFVAAPHGRDIRIELPFSFRLHVGFDGWQNISDRESEEVGFDLFGVVLSADDTKHHGRIDFTLWNEEESRWLNEDFSIQLTDS